MDSLTEAIVNKGIVREDILVEIKNKSRGKSFVVEMVNSLDVDDEKIANIFIDSFRFKKADLSNILPESLFKFTKELALKYMCIPYDREGKNLRVAMVDPLDFNAIQAVEFLAGVNVIPHVTSKTELINAINNCFEASADITKIIEVVTSGEDGIEFMKDNDNNQNDVFQTANRKEITFESSLSTPAVKLVNLMIKEASQSRASDIHIEPSQKTLNVRMRIDGVLKTYTQIPRWLHPAIVSRIKIMSKLDISNKKTPQDGGIKVQIGDTPIDLRISTLPTHFGEKVVIRILKQIEGSIKLSDTGFDKDEFEKIDKMASKPQGMILVTGPTGSGKTTTLHSILRELRSEGTNIITVEDPIEYELEGITQVQVNEKAGLTFVNTLRSILRQDPDIVMIGEIRDHETAEIAFRAAMTGHLVLSTLHTTGTASTISRLFDIGVEPFLLSPALNCIMSQRLVRVICKDCITEYTPEESAFAVFPDINKKNKFHKGVGCDACNNTGYKGRVPVLEIMEVTPSIKKLIADKASPGEIKEQARKEGMRTLYESAIEKVYNGITTLDEVLRVITVKETSHHLCSNCERLYTGDECPYCGDLSEDECKKCHRLLEVDWGFCPFCGKPAEKTTTPEITEKPRVLIVDDELGILKMTELALKPLDVEIYTSQNGKEAIHKIKEVKPHLLITDINMPVMDGFELIKQLRSKVETMFMPIIILSSRSATEDKLKGFTYGSDDYITKPFDYSELQARVKRLIQKTYGIQKTTEGEADGKYINS